MPKYDLRCDNCNNEFHISASMSDKKEKRIVCPECGGNDLSAVFKAAPAYIKNRTPECPNSRSCGAAGCPAKG